MNYERYYFTGTELIRIIIEYLLIDVTVAYLFFDSVIAFFVGLIGILPYERYPQKMLSGTVFPIWSGCMAGMR